MTSKPLRLLIVEDSEDDAELVVRTVRAGGYDPDFLRVQTAQAVTEALRTRKWDVVVSDYSMPGFSGTEALKILQKESLDIPFILVSGSLGEEAAVEILKAGAHDFIIKDRMARLVPAIERELREAGQRFERRQAYEILARSENQLADAQRIAHVGSWERNLETDQLSWSAESIRIFGQDPNIFVPTVEKFVAQIHPDDRPRLAESMDKARRLGALLDNRYRVVRPNGEIRVVESRGQVEKNAEGKFVRIVGTIQDLTEHESLSAERKKLEEQLLQAQKMEAIGQLAGGIAHDFNNFLSVILGYSELVQAALRGNDAMATVMADVGEIRSAAEKAATLTRQLLAFSRRQVLQPMVMDLGESLAGLENMVRRLIGENIKLEVIPGKNVGLVKADPGQMEQVIMNLIVNARDAMPQGGRLTLETRDAVLSDGDSTVVPAGHYALLVASDTGKGMDPQVMARIFEPFFTTKEKGKGTGLGLSMVYGVVKQTGGYITVESEVGRGTRFYVYFPVAEEDHADKTPASAPAGVSAGASETILLVEDDTAIRTMVGKFLRKQSYTVLEAGSGEEALVVANGHGKKIDLMITDIVMPGITGLELAQKLTQQRTDLKVLYVSGYSDHAAFQNEVPELSSKYLMKPFSPDILSNKVREILSRG
jgi:signal transduction histidine kinase